MVCVNGGAAAVVPGDWSASIEWLVGRLAPAHPDVAFHEVRYRTKSWNRLDSCIEDAVAALDAASRDGRPVLLIGFSMGGAVSIGASGHAAVAGVVGLAPWIPDRLPVDGLRGKRLAVIQGSLDGWIPGVPGISPRSSRRGYERVRAAGVPATYHLIHGAVHPIALRWGGRPVPAPRARTWARLVSAEVARFQAEEGA
ncbi:MAG TPA: alpha/beta fold hydrolase [Miltoncostaeaceae bacterium]|nr:alpha/beta fold hydrolase [Miltoncostaeaceae bacterium]